jgi:hypothetical protein
VSGRDVRPNIAETDTRGFTCNDLSSSRRGAGSFRSLFGVSLGCRADPKAVGLVSLKRSQTVSFLVSWDCTWDAEIILRSFYETAAKIPFISFAEEEQKAELIREYWDVLGRADDRKRARKAGYAQEVFQERDCGSERVFAALQDDGTVGSMSAHQYNRGGFRAGNEVAAPSLPGSGCFAAYSGDSSQRSRHSHRKLRDQLFHIFWIENRFMPSPDWNSAEGRTALSPTMVRQAGLVRAEQGHRRMQGQRLTGFDAPCPPHFPK